MIMPSDFHSGFTAFEAGLLSLASLTLLVGTAGFFWLQFTRRNRERIRLPSIILFGIGLTLAGISFAFQPRQEAAADLHPRWSYPELALRGDSSLEWQ
jgi:hypothetical protein